MKTVDIFLKTFGRDFWLLKVVLESIKRNVVGYYNLILVIPATDQKRFRKEFESEQNALPPNTITFFVDYPGPNGYIWQQWFKMRAFEYSSSEYIMYTDADCIFDRSLNVRDLIKGDKPEIIYRAWDTCEGWFWKKATEDFMGEQVPYEFMARQNMVVHRRTLENIATKMPKLKDKLLKLKPYKFSKNEDRFSEYNAIGAYCYKYEQSQYTFLAESDLPWIKSSLGAHKSGDPGYNIDTYSLQAWSHASKEGDVFSLKEYIKLLEGILKSYDIPVPLNPNKAKKRPLIIRAAINVKKLLKKVESYYRKTSKQLFSRQTTTDSGKPRRRKREDHELGW